MVQKPASKSKGAFPAAYFLKTPLFTTLATLATPPRGGVANVANVVKRGVFKK
jgi:hypothetical protein